MSFEVLSTDERIQQGLLEVLKDKPFRLVSNGDIIDKAEVSLRTFYRYYKDKNALLDQIENHLIVEFKKTLKHDYNKQLSSKEEAKSQVEEISRLIMNDVLNFAVAHKEPTKILLSENGDLAFWNQIKEVVENKFKESFKYIFKDDFVLNSYIQLQLNSYVDSKLVFILNWLDFTDTISINDAEKLLNSTFSLSL